MGNNTIITCRACGEQFDKKTMTTRRNARYNDFTQHYEEISVTMDFEEALHFHGWKRVESRQGNYFFICRCCARPKYSTKRSDKKLLKEVVGVEKVNGQQTGIEVENTSLKHSYFLYENNFLLVTDGSVNGDGVECVSPIYNGLSAIPKVLQTIYIDGIEKCEQETGREFIDASCGTHVHVSNLNQWDIIKSFVNDLQALNDVIYPLERYIVEHKESTIKVWGRYLNSYCDGAYTDYETKEVNNSFTLSNGECVYRNLKNYRYTWINFNNFFNAHHTNDPICTIEFRLPKFVDKDQFMNLIKWCHRFYQIIIDNKHCRPSFIGELILQDYIKFFKLQY